MHVNTIELAFPVDFLQTLLSKRLLPNHERRFSAEVSYNSTKGTKRKYDGSVKTVRKPCTLNTFCSNAKQLRISLFVDSLFVNNSIVNVSVDDVKEINYDENKTQPQNGTRRSVDDHEVNPTDSSKSIKNRRNIHTDTTVMTTNQRVMGKHAHKTLTKRYEKLRTHCRRTRMLPKSLQNDYVTTWKPSHKNNQTQKISEKCNTKVQSIVSKKDVFKKTVTQKHGAKPLRKCEVQLFDCRAKGKLSNSVEERLKPNPNINSKVTTIDGKTFVTFNVLNKKKKKNEPVSSKKQNTKKMAEAVVETPLEMMVNSHIGHGASSESDDENADKDFDDLDDDYDDDDDDDDYDDDELDENYEPDEKLSKAIDRRRNISGSLWKSPVERKITRKYSKEKQSLEVCNELEQDNISESLKPARKRAARKASANSLTVKLAVLKKRLAADSIIPLSQLELSQMGSETGGYLQLKPTKYPIYTSIKGDNFEILSSTVLKGSYEKASSLPAPLYLEGLCVASQSSVLLGPFKVIDDPISHLQPLSEEESTGAVKPVLEVTGPQSEDQKKQKRPMVMDLKWPKTGILGDRKVALVDHEYLAGRHTKPSRPNGEVTERHRAMDWHSGDTKHGGSGGDTRRTKTNVVDLSKSDDEMDLESEDEDEQPMIVINNLREASTKFYKQDEDAISNPSTVGCIFEPVKFEDIPPALKEITVGVSGKTVARKFRHKNKVSSDDNKTPRTHVEKTCDGIVIESLQELVEDGAAVPSYTCKYCLKLLSSAATLFSHVKVVHSGSLNLHAYLQEIKERMKVKCPQCADDVWLLGYKNLAQHTRIFHHEDDCSVLYDRLPKLSEENVGRRKKRSGVDSVMLCHLCPATFKCKSFFEKHLKEHDIRDAEKDDERSCGAKQIAKVDKLVETRNPESRTNSFSCDVCCEPFDSLNKMKSHKIAEHDGRIPLHCPFCVLGYQDRLNLYRHIGRIHLDVLPHKCPKCPKLFDRVTSLEHHLHKQHVGELPEYKKPAQEQLECPYCPDVFMSGHPLVQHLIDSHQDTFPYKCTKCSLRFLEERFMHHHMVNAHWNKTSEDNPSPVVKTKDVKTLEESKSVINTVEQYDENKEGKVIKCIEDLPIEAQNAVKDLQERGKSAVVVVNFHDEKSKLIPSQSRKTPAKKMHLSRRTVIATDQPDILNSESLSQSHRSSEISPQSQRDGVISNLLKEHLLGNPASTVVESESIHYDDESSVDHVPRNPGSITVDDSIESMHYVTIGDASSVAVEDAGESMQYVTVASSTVETETENTSAHYVTMSDGTTAALATSEGLSYYESASGESVLEEDQTSYIEEYVYGVQPTEVVEEVVEDSVQTAIMEGFEEVITIPISQLAGNPVFQGQQVEILSPDSVSAADLMKLIGESNLK